MHRRLYFVDGTCDLNNQMKGITCDIIRFLSVSKAPFYVSINILPPTLAVIRMRVRVGVELCLRRSNRGH